MEKTNRGEKDREREEGNRRRIKKEEREIREVGN